MNRRTLALLFAVLFCATGLVTADEPPYDGAHFKRVTFVVADMERSLQIYRDILGFTLDEISDSSHASYSYPVFKIDPEAKLRFATLSAGPEQVRTMALTEITGMELPKPGVPLHDRFRDPGRQSRRRLREARGARARDRAANRLRAPRRVQVQAEQAFVDFDGHLVVLYQMLPLE